MQGYEYRSAMVGEERLYRVRYLSLSEVSAWYRVDAETFTALKDASFRTCKLSRTDSVHFPIRSGFMRVPSLYGNLLELPVKGAVNGANEATHLYHITDEPLEEAVALGGKDL